MAGEGPPSTTYLRACGKAVDADLRRYDGVSIAGGSTLRASGIIASSLRYRNDSIEGRFQSCRRCSRDYELYGAWTAPLSSVPNAWTTDTAIVCRGSVMSKAEMTIRVQLGSDQTRKPVTAPPPGWPPEFALTSAAGSVGLAASCVSNIARSHPRHPAAELAPDP